MGAVAHVCDSSCGWCHASEARRPSYLAEGGLRTGCLLRQVLLVVVFYRGGQIMGYEYAACVSRWQLATCSPCTVVKSGAFVVQVVMQLAHRGW